MRQPFCLRTFKKFGLCTDSLVERTRLAMHKQSFSYLQRQNGHSMAKVCKLLPPRTKLLCQLYSNCFLTFVPYFHLLQTEKGRNPSHTPIQCCFGLKIIMCDSRVILNNMVQLKGGGKSGIHFATVSIFGRMTGKHRYFCETCVSTCFVQGCTVSCLPNL